MTEAMTAADPWPFSRQDPTCIVLPPRAGHEPSPKPPVRIFLGTEEAQYRAERIFFYSIERVRDPARTYEIHLMKNVSGFDRRKWRTGFTNYRYAIPSFAGGTGRAIYNDVDQIYLADPAELFDIDMGSHGYMAISAKDTSVMVMDCSTMIGVWNREAAAGLGKHELINKPSQQPGLWGKLDGHWNARDQEYIEGRTKCLHYTALHQQPWEPFPDDYSYHPNPLAYIWHDLERAADQEGYRLFTADAPSPDFARVTAGAAGERLWQIAPSAAARALFAELAIRDALICHVPHAPADAALPAGVGRRALEVHAQTDWPQASAEAVVASDLLRDLPPADLPWLLDRLFAAARKLVYVQFSTTAAAGMGSVAWWERRLREAAHAYPAIHWQIDARDASAALPDTVAIVQSRPLSARAPVAWVMASGDDALDAGMAEVAAAAGASVHRIAVNETLPEPVPGAILCGDADGCRRALACRSARGEGVKVVQFGHTGVPPVELDLLVTTPDERVPIRPNVEHVVVPIQGDIEAAPRRAPLLVVAPVQHGYRRDLGRLAAAGKALGEGLRIWFEPGLNDDVRAQLKSLVAGEDVSIEPIETLIASASRVALTLDQRELIALAANAGTAIDLVRLDPAHERVAGARQLLGVVTLLTGGGTSYRGTPHQQHFVARSIDDRVIRLGWRLPRDLARLHRALIGRGLARWSDAGETVSSIKPLDDKARVADRLRRLMAEVTRRDASRAA